MEEINIEGHIFLIDHDATYHYHDMYNQQCTCCYCRNFLLGFRNYYPQVVELLKTFGIDVEYPIEIMEFGYDKDKGTALYYAYYSVKGKLPSGTVEFTRDGVMITCSSREDAGYSNTGMNDPCFIVEIESLYLPWLLDEPYPG